MQREILPRELDLDLFAEHARSSQGRQESPLPSSGLAFQEHRSLAQGVRDLPDQRGAALESRQVRDAAPDATARGRPEDGDGTSAGRRPAFDLQ